MKNPAAIKQVRFQKMVEEIEDYAILLLDNEGNIENWNKGAEKIKGYKESEVLGKHFRIFYPAEDQKNQVPEGLIQTAARDGRVKSEGWRVRQDGTRFWGSTLITAIHDTDNEVIGFTKITRDLTARKRFEENLRQSEDRYSKMIAEIQDYAILLMDMDGNIQNWNWGAQRIKGYLSDEIVGRNFRRFYTPEDLRNKKPDMLLQIATREGRAHDEGWRMRKDGTRFWASVTLTALHNEQGKVVGFSKVTRDLTEKKKSEEAMLHMQTMAARNQELEQLTYITSHDLQEPLGNILNLIELLKDEHGEGLNEEIQAYLNYISDSAGRMRKLINGLLDYGRLGRNAEVKEIDTARIMQEVTADLDALIRKTSTTVTVGELPKIWGYETEFRLLLQNLISNAIKFRKPDTDPEISVTATQQNGIWEFSVTDNGIGIEPQHQNRIFLIFQRLHSQQAYEGSGIGLAHCKKIVEMHNGQIGVRSTPGQGSTFYFTVNTNSLSQ